MPIRVVIAEDNALLRDGLARLVSSTRDFELAGTAGGYDELLTLDVDVLIPAALGGVFTVSTLLIDP